MRAWLIESLGVEGAAALFEAFGGKRLAIPYQPHGVRFNRVADALGGALAAQLVSMAAGDYIYIPVNKPRTIAEFIRAEIEARLREGQSVAHIAQTYTTPPHRLSARHISTIKADMLKR